MDRMRTEEAIKIASFLLAKKSHPGLVRSTLINDGFNPIRATTIVRWAQQFNLLGRKPVAFTMEGNLPEPA